MVQVWLQETKRHQRGSIRREEKIPGSHLQNQGSHGARSPEQTDSSLTADWLWTQPSSKTCSVTSVRHDPPRCPPTGQSDRWDRGRAAGAAGWPRPPSVLGRRAQKRRSICERQQPDVPTLEETGSAELHRRSHSEEEDRR